MGAGWLSQAVACGSIGWGGWGHQVAFPLVCQIGYALPLGGETSSIRISPWGRRHKAAWRVRTVERGAAHPPSPASQDPQKVQLGDPDDPGSTTLAHEERSQKRRSESLRTMAARLLLLLASMLTVLSAFVMSPPAAGAVVAGRVTPEISSELCPHALCSGSPPSWPPKPR